MILAGDVGATKILLEVGESRSGKWQPALAKRYSTADAESFPAVLTAFLGEWNGVREKGQRITAAGFGVAGPLQGNKVKMTNRPIAVDADVIESRFLIPKVRVMNDLAAAALGLDSLGPRDFATVQAGKAAPGEARVVMGVGTGLGVAYLVPDDKGAYQVVPGEGGHVGFAPQTPRQLELWRWIFAASGRVDAEEIVSGVGLTRVYSFVKGEGVHVRGAREDTVSAEWISEHAAAGDSVCQSALDLFFECMGNVAGDHALAVMARGGVYFTGGVVARLHTRLADSRFGEAFCAKGPFSATLMKIPVRAVTNERIVLIGAAKMAM